MQGPGMPARPCKADGRFPLGCGPHMCGPYTSALRFVGDGSLNATQGGNPPPYPTIKRSPRFKSKRGLFFIPLILLQ